MNWSGPFTCYCSCGWRSQLKSNPIAAQFAGESHIPQCSFYRDAMLVLRGEKELPVIDRSKYFDAAKFLKADGIKNNQTVTIEAFEEITTRLGLRPILRLKGFEEPLGLNATNLDKMVELHGEEEKKWAGKKITLVIVQAPNPQKGGKLGPAIRIA